MAPEGYDLDFSVSPHFWVRDNPVYCPVKHCNAHTHRFVLCGDPEGEYTGIHFARIRYVPKWIRLERRRVSFYRSLGTGNPALAASMARTFQDAIDNGLVKGRRGRRLR